MLGSLAASGYADWSGTDALAAPVCLRLDARIQAESLFVHTRGWRGSSLDLDRFWQGLSACKGSDLYALQIASFQGCALPSEIKMMRLAGSGRAGAWQHSGVQSLCRHGIAQSADPSNFDANGITRLQVAWRLLCHSDAGRCSGENHGAG